MGAAETSAAIAARLRQVEAEIAAAAERAGREPRSVRLVVVTKGHSPETVRQAYASGVRRFGENRVEEGLAKQGGLGDLAGVEWHLIGPIQSRKAKEIEGRFELLHAVDRLKIARLLDADAGRFGRPQKVLLECNVSGEASKAGWRVEDPGGWEGFVAEVRQVLSCSHLRVLGLMTMAPVTDDVAVQRRVFRRLAEARRKLQDELGIGLPELSMGMSDDYRAAVEEGSTLVRIGRAILGERE